MSSKPPDDFEAVRKVADTLQPFNADDRERILRWAREKLGMSATSPDAVQATQLGRPVHLSAITANQPIAEAGTDIKSFMAAKSPGSDVHFAVAVAYFHQFVAPDRKTSIGKDDLLDACRKVDRKRPGTPAQVLVNAYQNGLLDRAEKGQYKLNSVGENLVAMVLPGDPERSKSAGKRQTKKRKPATRSPKR